jgi:UDP-glucose 4-epimerase
MDVRSREMSEILKGADLLIHLAFVMFHRNQRRRATDINIDGSIQTYEMAAMRGVKRIVVASSHTVYGAHPDNPIPLIETCERRPNRALRYAWCKGILEDYLDQYETRNPQVKVIRLRPCTVWGHNVPTTRALLYLSSIAVSAKGYNAPIQLLHESDMAQAFLLATLEENAQGAYNIAPGDWICPHELRRALDIRALPLPNLAMPWVNRLMYRFNLTEIPPTWLCLAKHPVLLSNQKLNDCFGWSPTHNSIETARQTLDDIRGQKVLQDEDWPLSEDE